MTDKEVIEVLKARPELVEMLHLAAELDEINLEAIRILVEGLAAGENEAEAAHKAAEYLTDHGRPKAAHQVVDYFVET